MGHMWYPIGGVEAGIDGFIEIRDDVTGEFTNSVLQVPEQGSRWVAEALELSAWDMGLLAYAVAYGQVHQPPRACLLITENLVVSSNPVTGPRARLSFQA
jgi:hypothetical protein